MAILFRPNYFDRMFQDLERTMLSDLFDSAEDAPMEVSPSSFKKFHFPFRSPKKTKIMEWPWMSHNSNQKNWKWTWMDEFWRSKDVRNSRRKAAISKGLSHFYDSRFLFFRSFVRKWRLPKNADLSAVRSQLSDEGQLSIEVPKKTIETGIQIPIERNNWVSDRTWYLY